MAASVSTKNVEEKLSFLPHNLYDKLMPFQRDGVLFGLAKNGRCLIADEMGLGKTVQALSIAYYYKAHWPLLIVVPSSLKYPWIEEVEKWLPDIHPHDINLIQGGADIKEIPVASITVVTYGLLRHPSCKVVREALYNQQFKVIIVDESHYIKNRKTASTKYLVPLLQRTKHKILLTGTPALAKPEELYPQLDSIVPGKFGSWTSYANKYCDAKYRYIGRIRKWVTDGASNLGELQAQLTQQVMIRRLKKDVLKQLPAKQRQRIMFDLKESSVKKELEKAWNELNIALGRKKKSITSVLNGDEGDREEPPGNVDMLQVSQASTAGTTQVFGLLSDLYRTTCAAKIGPVKDYLKMLCQNEGLKFIVFAHHHIMMDSLAEQLMDDNIKYIRIDGNTAMLDRPRLVHEFQADESIRCALLGIRAAGVGLTLTAAKLVVFAELDWTPGTLEQCEDRAHRIGQKDIVHVHYLVAKGTLDERVWAALCRKTTIVTTTLNGQAQVLKVSEGNEKQIECLANAEAYIPQKRDAGDLATFLQTPQPKNQRSIVDFFTPKGSKKTMDADVTPTTSKPTRCHSRTTNDIIVLGESDDNPDEFWSPNTENREKRKRKKRTMHVVFSDDDDDGKLESFGCDDSGKVGNGNNIGDGRENLSVNDLGCDLDDIPTPRPKRRRVRASKIKTDYVDADRGESEITAKSHVLTDVKKTESNSVHVTKVGTEKAEAAGLQTPCKDTVEHNPWSCERCTYHNNHVLEYCEMCSTPKPAKKSSRCRDQRTQRNGQSLQMDSKLTTSSQTDNEKIKVNCDYANAANRQCTKIAGDQIDIVMRTTSNHKDGKSSSVDAASCHIADDVLRIKDDIHECDNSSPNRVTIVPGDCVDHETVVPDSDDNCESEDDADAKIEDFSDTELSPSLPRESQCSTNADISDIIEDFDTHGSSDAESHQDKRTSLSSVSATPKHSTNYEQSSDNFNTPPSQSQPITSNDEDVISMETAAAKQLFSPGSKKVSRLTRRPWPCSDCGAINDVGAEDCDGCLKTRPENISLEETKPDENTMEETKPQTRIVNLDNVPVHNLFKYCCSKNTSRVYLYSQNDVPLKVNFTPLDVELDNLSELPDMLLRQENLHLVQRFVREWNSLAPTKRRLVIKSGEIFTSPVLLYEKLLSGRQRATQRYTTKLDTATAALSKAEEIGGTVRVLQRPEIPKKRSRYNQRKGVQFDNDEDDDSRNVNNTVSNTTIGKVDGLNMSQGTSGSSSTIIQAKQTDDAVKNTQGLTVEEIHAKMKGILQVMSSDGIPLCVHCHKPYHSDLVTKTTIQKNPWQTRFCSRICMDQYWMQSHRGYSAQQVFNEEHGICQICGFDAQQFFTRIKNTLDLYKRAKLIQESKYGILKTDIKQKMARNPVKGQFWEVDHIRPVVEGGGMCDIDNLRTLCVLCHRDVTSQLLRDRAKQKQRRAAAQCGDITAFFKAK